jgi:KDO2-lipid IV(A) lauroyltransferase
MDDRPHLDRRARDYLVYLVIRTTVCLLQCLSIESAYAASRVLARLAYIVDRRHRTIAIENLRLAFGDTLCDKDRRRMVLATYEHFCQVAVEFVFIPRKLRVTNYRRHVSLALDPRAIDLLVQDRAKIILTGHFGNWEMAGYLIAVFGIRPYSIARDLDNPFLHDFVKRFRSWSGQTILSKKGDFERIEQVLRERGTLLTVGDQDAGPRGTFVEFFGKLASTHKAIALLSAAHEAPIIVGVAYRDRPGFHFQVICHAPIEPADAGVAEITQRFTRDLESAIREAPEQYLWLHRRWKHQPAAREKRRAA